MNNLLANLSVQQLKQALVLREKIEALEREFDQLVGAPAAVTTARPRKGVMGDAQRAKIAAAQRARWAERKGLLGQSSAPQPKKKRRYSAAGLAAIQAANQARWARYRAAKKKAAR